MPAGSSNTAGLPASLGALLERAAELARSEDAFESAEVDGGVLRVTPADCEHECDYRVEAVDGSLFAGWYTPDRYLSQSVEAELVYTGDDLDDLVDEELADQPGWTLPTRLAPFEHLRTESKVFTFRSRTPLGVDAGDSAAHAASLIAALVAYDLAVRQLGDMKPDDE
ncbi:MAG: hypothetical protein AAGI30_13415 [Planctomycetota bacterium]